MKTLLLHALAVVVWAWTAVASANDPQAARSVHLFYSAPPAQTFYNEVRVEESTNGSYFMVCDFSTGYFGFQQLDATEKKVVIFSVWDPTKGDDPNSVPTEQRVEVLFHAPDVEVERFGGEGTGAQSFFRYPWSIGATYRFAVQAQSEAGRTAYHAFFYLNDESHWKRLASFRTRTKDQGLVGLYSFVEDFRRDGRSPNERRSAIFANGWVRTTNDQWTSLTNATFTADGNPLNNINASSLADGFRLETGGAVTQSAPLRSLLVRTPVGLPDAPAIFQPPSDPPRAKPSS